MEASIAQVSILCAEVRPDRDLAGPSAGNLPSYEGGVQATTRLRKYVRMMWRL
jgi:hypothetical protein